VLRPGGAETKPHRPDVPLPAPRALPPVLHLKPSQYSSVQLLERPRSRERKLPPGAWERAASRRGRMAGGGRASRDEDTPSLLDGAATLSACAGLADGPATRWGDLTEGTPVDAVTPK
jgi:hypothetical protein